MEVSEIFKKLSAHSIKGVMIHNDMSNMFDFLNLKGYKRLQEYRAREEMKGLRKLNRYYISRYNRLIPFEKVDAPEIIPAKWFEHTKQDVDVNTKRTSVKDAFKKWVKWEQETLDLYEKMYSELVSIGEIETSIKLGGFIKDVSEELERAQSMKINLDSVDYAMDCILDVQQQLHDEFKSK